MLEKSGTEEKDLEGGRSYKTVKEKEVLTSFLQMEITE